MNNDLIDDHGQPLNRLYNRKQLNDRAIDELIGLARGIVSDDVVNQKEGEFLLSWMEANIAFCEDPLINQLYSRVQEMLSDGFLAPNEQVELLGILKEFSGESTVGQPTILASTFPLCKPPPPVHFRNNTFCLTGKFAYGPRAICEEVVKERGGEVSKIVTQTVNYLVIGTFSSTDWIHTSYGRKIEKAVTDRDNLGRIAIISEDHWAKAAFP